MKAYKCKLSPSIKQQELLNEYMGINRFVWNKLLRMNLDRLESKHGLLWRNEAQFWLKIWKRSEEYSFLKNAPSQTLQQTIANQSKAFKDCFDKKQPLKRLPRFKKAGRNDAGLTFPQGFAYCAKSKRVKLPKVGWINLRLDRKALGEIRSMTITRKSGKYYVSVLTKQEINAYNEATTSIGIDVGIKNFVTLSNGEMITPFKDRRRIKRLNWRIKVLQKRLAKKKKGSNNWNKTRLQIAKKHSKVTNIRRDFLHKLSTTISKNHAIVAVEDLKVKNMSKSAKGSIDKPGSNVKAKADLNKAILAQGWSMFVDMLEYKLDWNGGVLVKVDPKHTSQQCPECDHTSKENRQTQSEFECVSCGYNNNADIVGAINILARGHRAVASGADALATAVNEEPSMRLVA